MPFYANSNNGTILKTEWEAAVCHLRDYTSALLWLLHRQLNLTQLLHQLMHIYKFYVTRGTTGQ